MLALIDGDIVVYRVGFTVQEEDEWIAIARTNDLVRQVLAEVGTEDYKLYISDSSGNFRKALYPEYKANRVQPKPVHYQVIKDHLFDYWKAELSTGQEADDSLGISQDTDTVICSIDKDLHQIPGEHYNFVKKEFRTISPEEGIRHFYHQLLTGDVTDNIPGIYGIGPKKAEKALAGLSEEVEFYTKVVDMYMQAYYEKKSYEQVLDMILLHGRLLKIRQKEGELWKPPLKQEEEAPSLSTQLLQSPSERSTEPMIQETQRLAI